MSIPSVGSDGLRMTVNRGITDDEKVWHFRSGWNVAALNCTAARYQPVLNAYSSYIKKHGRALKRVNDRIDRVYRRQMNSRRAAIRSREGRMTSVYNFFALPPARQGFCNNALDISNRYLADTSTDPVEFAMANFNALESPFDAFFNAYEAYERDAATWDAQYGERYGSSQPGWVAVQAAGGNRNAPTVQPTGFAADPATSGDAQVPIVPGTGNTVSQPVVEPIPNANPVATTGDE
ncbi:MAG: hypothetical protein AAGL68_10855 [Pseudomonadota bacterium]